MSVCIIGAGTAGLSAARHALANNLKPTIFEQTADVGGTWVYTENVGADAFGNDVHSSMYEGLRTNLPKEIMGFPDFPIDPKQTASYVPAKVIRDFLESFTEHFDLKQHIKFTHYVIRVTFKNTRWEVTVKNLQDNSVATECFDYILICNGHYNTPFVPQISGYAGFKGKKLHSHDYKRVAPFRGETVLVIGSGPSGMDLCNETSSIAKKVIMSHHQPVPKTKFRDNVVQKPDVIRFDENGAYFQDNSYESVSVVLFCTGYKYSFPFLSVDCGVSVTDNHIQPLYKHVFNIRNPTMAFIGLPFYVCAAQMIDLQSRFVMEYYSQRKTLPTAAEMTLDTENDAQKRKAEGLKGRQMHLMGPRQMEYYDDLATTAGIERMKPVMSKLHEESSQRFLDDLIHFRDDVFEIVDDENFIQIN